MVRAGDADLDHEPKDGMERPETGPLFQGQVCRQVADGAEDGSGPCQLQRTLLEP